MSKFVTKVKVLQERKLILKQYDGEMRWKLEWGKKGEKWSESFAELNWKENETIKNKTRLFKIQIRSQNQQVMVQ